MEVFKQTEQMTQFDNIRKRFNVCLVSLDLFEQLPRVQWCASEILLLRSFMVLPLKGFSILAFLFCVRCDEGPAPEESDCVSVGVEQAEELAGHPR